MGRCNIYRISHSKHSTSYHGMHCKHHFHDTNDWDGSVITKSCTLRALLFAVFNLAILANSPFFAIEDYTLRH